MGIFDNRKQDEIQSLILQNLQKLNERLFAQEQQTHEERDNAPVDAVVDESQNMLSQKDAEIETLKAELKQANEELQKAKEQISEMQAKIETLSEKPQETQSEPEKEDLIPQESEKVEIQPGEAAAPVDDVRLKEIEARLKEIAEKVEFNEYKDKLIKDLHEDLRENKRDYSAELSKPYLNYIVKLHHSLYDLAKRFEKEQIADDNFKKLLREVRNRMLDVQDALEEEFAMKYFEPEPGEEYIPKEHQAIQVMITDEEDKSGKIAEVAYGGFCNLNTGKVFKQAIVRPYRFEKKQEN